MSTVIVVGDIVRTSQTACYTGEKHIIHCLVIAIDAIGVSSLVITDHSMAHRPLDPARCVPVDHINGLPPINEDTEFESLPISIQELLSRWR